LFHVKQCGRERRPVPSASSPDLLAWCWARIPARSRREKHGRGAMNEATMVPPLDSIGVATIPITGSEVSRTRAGVRDSECGVSRALSNPASRLDVQADRRRDLVQSPIPSGGDLVMPAGPRAARMLGHIANARVARGGGVDLGRTLVWVTITWSHLRARRDFHG
jgi:hypothetical protein